MQKLLILPYKKSGKEGRTPEWLGKDLLVKLNCEKKMHMQWNQGDTLSEEYRDAAWMYRDGIKESKVQLELNLARDVRNNKGFCRYVDEKRKVKENVPLCPS